MGTTFIYVLSDPDTDEVRYVGKSNDPTKRLALHIRKTDERTHKANWLKSLAKRGVGPKLEVVDEVPEGEWDFWEQHWIQVFSGWGFNLTNGDRGGLGGHRYTQELRDKISKSLTGRLSPVKWKRVAGYDLAGNFAFEAISVSAAAEYIGSTTGNVSKAIKILGSCNGYQLRGVPYGACEGVFYSKKDIAYRFPIRIAPYVQHRHPMSESTKAILRKAQAGKGVSASTRQKMRTAKLGKSPANKGVPMSDEAKARLVSASTCSRPVYSVGLNGFVLSEWPSVKNAAEQTGASRSGIAKTIAGTSKHANSRVWFS